MEFFDGSTSIGTGTLGVVGGNDQATLTTSLLAPVSHQITAVYKGDSNFTGSTSPVLVQVVTKPSVTVTSSINPSVVGQGVKFTATVPGTAGLPPPTGFVEFLDGTSTVLGVVDLSTVGDNGQASLTISSLTAGSHQITAAYSGDHNYEGVESPPLDQVVDNPPSGSSS